MDQGDSGDQGRALPVYTEVIRDRNPNNRRAPRHREHGTGSCPLLERLSENRIGPARPGRKLEMNVVTAAQSREKFSASQRLALVLL